MLYSNLISMIKEGEEEFSQDTQTASILWSLVCDAGFYVRGEHLGLQMNLFASAAEIRAVDTWKSFALDVHLTARSTSHEDKVRRSFKFTFQSIERDHLVGYPALPA